MNLMAIFPLQQLPCQVVNTQNPLQVDPPRQCPAGKTCQPLPRDYYGRQALIYRPINEPGYEARYCQVNKYDNFKQSLTLIYY